MPGTVDHVEGVVVSQEMRKDYHDDPELTMLDVEGLQAILEKFAGKRVSIIVEELEES